MTVDSGKPLRSSWWSRRGWWDRSRGCRSKWRGSRRDQSLKLLPRESSPSIRWRQSPVKWFRSESQFPRAVWSITTGIVGINGFFIFTGPDEMTTVQVPVKGNGNKYNNDLTLALIMIVLIRTERYLSAWTYASPNASQTELSSMEKSTKKSSTTSSHRWAVAMMNAVISPLKDVLAALTVEEANGLDTKADSNSPEAEPEIGAVIGSGANDNNFATVATLVFILSTMYFS